ncbi:MAG TPA: hypothetical protein DD638_05280 [Pasteurellaceae bacterium]|nr:hypothetical protein [Pasteurellaceae bacterium]
MIFAGYGKNGREVIAIANAGKPSGKKEITLKKMKQKILELEKQGKRVSLHCVSEDTYKALYPLNNRGEQAFHLEISQ